MSTRATIRIKFIDRTICHIYHHCDGGPQYVGSCLKLYLAKKNPVYEWDGWDIANDILKGLAGDMEYELTPCQHGDEEYGYLIDCDSKRSKCYRLAWNETEWKEEKVIKIP